MDYRTIGKLESYRNSIITAQRWHPLPKEALKGVAVLTPSRNMTCPFLSGWRGGCHPFIFDASRTVENLPLVSKFLLSDTGFGLLTLLPIQCTFDNLCGGIVLCGSSATCVHNIFSRCSEEGQPRFHSFEEQFLRFRKGRERNLQKIWSTVTHVPCSGFITFPSVHRCLGPSLNPFLVL